VRAAGSVSTAVIFGVLMAAGTSQAYAAPLPPRAQPALQTLSPSTMGPEAPE
jgi:hypothetical protein